MTISNPELVLVDLMILLIALNSKNTVPLLP